MQAIQAAENSAVFEGGQWGSRPTVRFKRIPRRGEVRSRAVRASHNHCQLSSLALSCSWRPT